MKPAALLTLLTFVLAAQDFPRRFQSVPEIVIPPNDILKIDPQHYRLQLENEKVRVLRVTLGPGESVPMHDAAAATLVCLTDCHVRFTPPNGRVEDVHMEAGETRWIWDEIRSEKNLSTHKLEMLWIEVKPGLQATLPSLPVAE
jgi:hypothetical protein